MSGFERFLWGLVGGFAREVVKLWRVSQDDGVLGIPPLYRRLPYWLSFPLMLGVGGAAAAASTVDHPFAAFAIGVAAPPIIEYLYNRPPKLPPAL